MDGEQRLKYLPAMGHESYTPRSDEIIIKKAAQQAFFEIAMNVAGDNDELMTMVGDMIRNNSYPDGPATALLLRVCSDANGPIRARQDQLLAAAKQHSDA